MNAVSLNDGISSYTFFLTLTLSGLNSDLFVVLLKGGKIFSASENSPSSIPSPT